MSDSKAMDETSLIDPKKTALVVIDLQKGIVNRDHNPHSGKQVVENTAAVAEALRAKGGFVVLVRVSTLDGKDMLKPALDAQANTMQFQEGWDQLVPEIAALPAHLVTKRQWGAFYGTDLDLQLRRRGIDTILLTGISTSIGVDTTAREAYQHGYNQIFIEDAMTAGSEQEHDYVCGYIFPRIGRTRSTRQVLDALK